MHNEAHLFPGSSNNNACRTHSITNDIHTREININELLIKEMERNPEDFSESWNYKSTVSEVTKNISNSSYSYKYNCPVDCKKTPESIGSEASVCSINNNCSCRTALPASSIRTTREWKSRYFYSCQSDLLPQPSDYVSNYAKVSQKNCVPIDESSLRRYDSHCYGTYTNPNQNFKYSFIGSRGNNCSTAYQNFCGYEGNSSHVNHLYDEDVHWMSKLRINNSHQMAETIVMNVADTHDSFSNRNQCCSFCYGLERQKCVENGKPIPKKDDYGKWSTHSCARNKKVVCPVLYNVICKKCGATGENAHTTKNCWKYTNEPRNDNMFHSQSLESYFRNNWQKKSYVFTNFNL